VIVIIWLSQNFNFGIIDHGGRKRLLQKITNIQFIQAAKEYEEEETEGEGYWTCIKEGDYLEEVL